MKRNARFWIRHDGSWVKLTLAPGDVLEHASSQATEEGYSSSYTCLEFDGETVTRTIHTRERDCDGMHTDSCELVCPLAYLASHPPYDTADPTYCPTPGALLPSWEEQDSRRRDYYAEAAGY